MIRPLLRRWPDVRATNNKTVLIVLLTRANKSVYSIHHVVQSRMDDGYKNLLLPCVRLYVCVCMCVPECVQSLITNTDRKHRKHTKTHTQDVRNTRDQIYNFVDAIKALFSVIMRLHGKTKSHPLTKLSMAHRVCSVMYISHDGLTCVHNLLSVRCIN